MPTTKEFQERVGRIEGLVQKLESAADPALRKTARELIAAFMEIHGAALERLLEIVSSAGSDAGAVIVDSLGNDELVTSLLVLYGLHPHDFGTRVRRALDKARPLLRPHGARLEVIAIAEDAVHLKLLGAASSDLENAVREALFETAPDATNVIIEGVKAAGSASGFVPLTSLRAASGSTSANPVLP